MGTEKLTTEHVNRTMDGSIAERKAVATVSDIRQQFATKDTLHYIKSDDAVANPALLLGCVFYEQDGKSELQQFATGVDGKTDDSSILKTPLVRSEMIIDQKIGASADIMSYVSLKLEVNEVFEFRVLDNFAARINIKGKEWRDALTDWMDDKNSSALISRGDVGDIGIVIGIVQKYISTKKYKKFDCSVKGGAFGVNVGGELYASSSEYSLDIVYGLNMVYLPRVASPEELSVKIDSGLPKLETGKLEQLNNSLSLAIQRKGISSFLRK